MQKWEYLTIVAYYSKADQQWHPRYEQGQEIPNWERTLNVNLYLNSLGDQGWELVSETYINEVYGYGYSYFWTDAEASKLQQKLREMDSTFELVGAAFFPVGEGNWLFLFSRPASSSIIRFRFKRPKS